MIVRLWRYLCHHVLGTKVALPSIRTTFTLPLIVDPSWGVVNVTKIVLLSIRHALSFISNFLISNWFTKVPQGDYFCISFHWKDLGVWSDHCSLLHSASKLFDFCFVALIAPVSGSQDILFPVSWVYCSNPLDFSNLNFHFPYFHYHPFVL